MKFKLFFLVSLFLLLTGCYKAGEELYALPQPPQRYVDLQAAINTVLTEGAEYSAPVSGSNRQAITLIDLDKDGTDEAVAALKFAGEENPLKIYVFRIDPNDGSYYQATVIDGTGNAFESIEFAQLDGTGSLEIIIGWQVSNEVLQALTVYSVEDFSATQLMRASYAEFKTVDFDGDGLSELAVISYDSVQLTGTVDLYSSISNQLMLTGTAPLSQGINSLMHVKAGELSDGVAALYIAGDYGQNGIITDIFAIQGESFKNISYDSSTQISTETQRNKEIFATDVDGDGVLELPRTVDLQAYDQTDTGTFWKIQWYAWASDGTAKLKQTTYHDFNGGWYLIIPRYWKLAIDTNDSITGEKAVLFYDISGKTPELMFTIYTLTGDNRENRASGKLIFLSSTDTIYAADISEDSTIDPTTLRKWFYLIKKDWDNGDI